MDHPLAAVVEERLEEARDRNAHDRVYTSLLHSRAREQASRLDATTSTAHLPLFGMLVAVKDNIDVGGMPTTCGSVALARAPSAQDAPIVRRLEQAGAIIVGKTNLDEAALGASGRNEHFGRCVNPREEGLLSGGSSSGSAASVASGGVRLSIGTDTLGSVRIPAALCGVVGFKPSHGALTLEGVAPLYPPFDTVGLIAGSLQDIGLAYRALGHSRVDVGLPKSPPDPPRILVLAESALADVEPDVAAHYRRCCERLRQSPRVSVNELAPCDFAALSRAALWRVAGDFAARLGFTSRAFSDRRVRLGHEIFHLLERAVALPASKFAEGDRIIDRAHRQLLAGTLEADAVLTPTCPVRAIGATADLPRTLPSFVVPANVAGLPAVSWPQTVAAPGQVGQKRLVDENGVTASCSLQLIGRAGCDAQLIDLAGMLQTLLGGDASRLGGRSTVYPACGSGSAH